MNRNATDINSFRATFGGGGPPQDVHQAMEDSSRNEPLPWLIRFPHDDGVVQISQPRRFAHDESTWDEQAPPNYHAGRGLVRLIELEGGGLSGPALEIGCGTGAMTVGLCESGQYPLNLITDPSPVFVRMTRNALVRAGLNLERTQFGVLMAEDINLLPPETFSLVAMRYTLHHITDVAAFLQAVARLLKNGGIFACEEPCWEGYVLMGAMAQFLPAVARADGVRLTEEQTNKLTLFTDTMRFYARRDVDKSQGEDKHLFRVDEMMHLGRQCGMEVTFVSNCSYEKFSGVTSWPLSNGHNFTKFFQDYLKYHMAFDEALVRLFDRYLAPYCKYIEELSAKDNGPYMAGVFCCRKSLSRTISCSSITGTRTNETASAVGKGSAASVIGAASDFLDTPFNNRGPAKYADKQPLLNSILDRANAHYARNDWVAARDSLSLAVELAPDQPQVRVALGSLQYQLHDYADACASFTTATTQSPDNPDFQTQLAMVHIALKQEDKAKAALQRAVNLNPSHSSARQLLGGLDFQAKRYADAALHYCAALGCQPKNVNLLLHIGKCLYEMDDLASARWCFENVIALEPAHAIAVEAIQNLAERSPSNSRVSA